MNLANLPDEILMMIFEMLDVKSLYNLHTASDHVKSIIHTYGAIKTCNLSVSLLAKADTLKLPFFQDISRNLKELNVCGVCDLTKTGLIAALKRLKCLNKLDVTYTNITMTDVIDIVSVCPTITDIGVNFAFSEGFEGILNLFCEVFKKFLNVHFVGYLHVMMYSRLPNLILKDAKLKNLQYTIVDKIQVDFYPVKICKNGLNFESFRIHVSPTVPVNCRRNELNHIIDHYGCLRLMGPFDMLDFSCYELIVILLSSQSSPKKPVCCATPMFGTFFNKYSNLQEQIELHIVNTFDVTISGNVYVMLWNKSSIKFDEIFFSNLSVKLKHLIPCYFDSSSNTPVVPGYEFYVTTGVSTIPQEVEQPTNIKNIGSKRKRHGAPSCVLNYDSVFQEKNKIKLMINFLDNNATRIVTLPKSCEYISKLTYLNLNGPVNFSSDFFNILFRCCNNLTTLRVNAYSTNTFCSALARSLPLSHSIKHVHLMDRHIDFPLLYVFMSQCITLENVHIFDRVTSKDFTNASVIFEKCVNLYCFYLYIRASCPDKKKFMQIFRKANRNDMYVRLLFNEHLTSDPYSEVFQVNSYFK